MRREWWAIALLAAVCLLVLGARSAVAQEAAGAQTVRSYVFCQSGELWVADRNGEGITRIAGGPDFPRAELLYPSPNARRIAWITEDEGELWCLDRGAAIRSLGPVGSERVAWSPNDRLVMAGDLIIDANTGRSTLGAAGLSEGGRGSSSDRLQGWVSDSEALFVSSTSFFTPGEPGFSVWQRVGIRDIARALGEPLRDRELWARDWGDSSTASSFISAAASPTGDRVAIWTSAGVSAIDLNSGEVRALASAIPRPAWPGDEELIWTEDGRTLYAAIRPAGGEAEGRPPPQTEAWRIDAIEGGLAETTGPPEAVGMVLPPGLRARLLPALSAHADSCEHLLRGGRIVCATQRPPQYWLPEPRDRHDAVIHVSSVSAGAEVYVEGAFCAVAPCDVRVSDLPAQGRRVRLALLAARAPIVCQQWFVQRGLDAADSVALDPDRLLPEGSALSRLRTAIVHEDTEAFLSLVAAEGMMIDLSLADNGEWGRYWSAEELRARLLPPSRSGADAAARAPSLRDVLFRTCRELFLRGRFVVDECLPVVGSDSWKAAAPVPAAATAPPDWSPYAEPYEIVLMCRRAPPAITGVAVVGLRR